MTHYIIICYYVFTVTNQLLKNCLRVHKVEISGAFGLNILRIGQMGEQSRAHNLFRTLHAFGASMRKCGAPLDLPAGMAELERMLSH